VRDKKARIKTAGRRLKRRGGYITMANTTRMTVAQAIVKFLDNQYVSQDGQETKFVEGFFTIFGHGIAVGLGEALDTNPGQLKVMQGRNEQGMCHVATAFAKQNNRKKIIACASSVGPGAANMVTACATATVNNIPLLVFPADTFASRQPDPVLQQLEQSDSLAVTTNDAFKPVTKYWDRITRPEHIMTALINAMRVLTDPAETGAVAIGLCQDVEGESYDFPDYFFQKRVHRITRPVAVDEELEDVAEVIANAKKPLVIVGGGVKYSLAGETVEKFCEEFKIPFGESQAGKSACKSSHPYCLGGIGVTGTLASNVIARDADVVIAIGSRLSDFTTSSKWLFKNDNVKFVTINNNKYHAYKMDAVKAVGDAKVTIEALSEKLRARNYVSSYSGEIEEVKKQWDEEMKRLAGIEYTGDDFEPIIKDRDPRTIPEFVKMTGGMITQTAALAAIREVIDKDANYITAGGSLPSCSQRMWTTDKRGGYHAEYGYSCMGYEVAASLGVKMADPDNEVYAVVGDASFQMLHSEIMTIMQEKQKVNILVFDNCGFGCINNLQMTHGIGSLATEFRYSDGKKPSGDLIPVDYAKIAEGYGLKSYTCKTIAELKAALEDAKKQTVACLFDLKVIPKTMTDGYESWWDVGIATTSEKESVRKAWDEVKEGRAIARKY
jgi:3D-(3,5/4)-trihydroxycyclohexane-1,2-dione acylhydrolase (decyclizing)